MRSQMMNFAKLIRSWYAVYLCDYGLTDKTIDILKEDIIKLLPKKKELDDCGVVKEVCYGYNQAEKGYNQAIEDMENILKEEKNG